MRRLARGMLGVVVGISTMLLAPALSSARSGDWDTYGVNNQRTGFNPAADGISPSAVKSLRLIWSTELGAAIITQPVAASGVALPDARGLVDLVYAATEHGRIAALEAHTGRVVWSRRLGYRHVSFCADLPNDDFGISGTPVIDRERASIYTMGGDGRLYELDLATGRIKRRWTMTRDPMHVHDYGALTLVNGILYVPFAGNCDTDPYHGFVAAIRVRDGKRVGTWFPSGARDGGGVWGFGGVSAEPEGRSIFAAVGNSDRPDEHARYAEHVVQLTPGLRVLSANYPGLPSNDADFGATPLLFRRTGCPSQLAVGDKFGSFFLYDRNRIASGPVQRIELGGSNYGQRALLGVAAYWPATATVFVSNPLDQSQYRHGVVAFHVTGSCRLSFEWSATDGPQGEDSTPTVAGGAVFFGNGDGHRVIALDARTGRFLWSSRSAIRAPVFAAPTVVGGRVYVSSVGGSVSAFRPAP